MLENRRIPPVVLALTKLQGTYTFEADAYDRVIECVPYQNQIVAHDKWKRYLSRSLADTECPYGLAHQESLAALWAVLLLCSKLEDSPFTVRTNHDALR